MSEIEIPFGAFDSELIYEEITIPDGFEAVIKDKKIILKRKENEDERIRKAIHIYLDWLDGRKDCAPKGEYSIRDMIAWLEKQGESIKIKKGKNYLCTKTHKYAGVEWIKGTEYYASDNYTLVNKGCEYCCPKSSKKEHNNLFEEVKYYNYIEKNGEQSYTTLVETGNGGINALVTSELPTNSCDNADYCSDCINKKGCINCENGDMKETEHKVEPNFHEGNWVVPIFNIGDTIIKKHNSDINKFGSFKITDITDGTYWYKDRIICDFTEQDEWELVEQKSTKWSEEDEHRAKDTIYFLDAAKSHYASTIELDACINWVESLKQKIEG